MEEQGGYIVIGHLPAKVEVGFRVDRRQTPLPGVGGEDLDGLGSPLQGFSDGYGLSRIEATNVDADAHGHLDCRGNPVWGGEPAFLVTGQS